LKIITQNKKTNHQKLLSLLADWDEEGGFLNHAGGLLNYVINYPQLNKKYNLTG